MARLIFLIAANIILLTVTLYAQKEKPRWAWARFLVFEGCIILVVLNAPHWFRDPFSPLQVLSWLFLAIFIVLALIGFWLLQFRGDPDGHFEHTTTLVTTGIYEYIRHPMYASLFFLTWGAFLKDVNPVTILIAVVSTAAAFMTARFEEKDCIEKFGDEYLAYMRKSKMFVPFVF
jgi:protein-S-isoprenylcysteine O-methyltransferase Ste14